MPTYRVTDPNTGVTLDLTGDAPPTAENLQEIFSKYQGEEDQSVFRQVADVPLQFGTGIAQGVRFITDAFGADNPVSENIRGVEDYLGSLLSAQAKQDKEEVSRIFQDAESKGLGEQLTAGLRALSVSPVDFLAQGLGTAVPTIAGGLAGAALKGGTLAARAAAATATGTGLGAIGGAGLTKSTIYDEVKKELSALDLPENVVEERAKLAQEYGGENLDQILLGAGLGALAAGTGLEKVLASRILKNAAVNPNAIKSAVFSGAKEAAPEFVQAAQEQIAGNVALQREGFEDIPTLRGVASAAALEGSLGFILGAGVDVSLPSPQKARYDAARASITSEVDRLREAAFREEENRRAQEFINGLRADSERRAAGQSRQVDLDAEAANARTRAADIAAPNEDEANNLAPPAEGRGAGTDVQFGLAYGRKIASTLGDYFPTSGQFSVVQGEPVPTTEGKPSTITSPAGARIDIAQPTFVVVDSEGKRYGQPLKNFEQANATAFSLNKEVLNQNVRGAILNSLETSSQPYDPDTTQRLFSYGYRTLNPDSNTFSTVAINEAAKTIGPQYAEGLSWRQVEALPQAKDNRGRVIGYQYKPSETAQPRVIVGLTKAQEINKARSQEGKPESNVFSLQETKSALGKSFPAITKNVPIDPKIGRLGAVNEIKSVLKSKNVISEIDSPEINALAKGLTGRSSVKDMDYGDLRLFYKKLADLPRFEREIKLPEFTFKPYSRENFVRGSKFIQQSNDKGVKPTRDEIIEAVGFSKEDPKIDEKILTLQKDLEKQGVVNAPKKMLALPAPTPAIDLEPIRKTLRESLKGFGLQDIGLSLERNLIKPTGEIAGEATEGFFSPSLRQIFLSVDRIDPDGSLTPEQRVNALIEVMNHEIIHAVRLLDLWKPSEWSNLEMAVSRIKKPGTDQTYLQIAQDQYSDRSQVIQIEEAVADMFRDYASKKLKIAGRPQSLLERLLQFFQRMRSALGGTGFQTYEDVLNRLQEGQIGARQRGEIRTLRATEEAVSKQGKIPERLRPLLGAARPAAATAPAAPVAPAAPAATQAPPAPAAAAASPTAAAQDRLVETGEIRESRAQNERVPEKIDVDGKEQPTRDSENRLIYSGAEGPALFGMQTAPTQSGLQNFWRWFSNSKAKDSKGRPLVYYHGTAADITAFRPKQAGAVFVTRNIPFAESFGDLSSTHMIVNFPDFIGEREVLDVLNESMRSATTPKFYDRLEKIQKRVATRFNQGKGLDAKSITDIKELYTGKKVLGKTDIADGVSSSMIESIEKRLPSNANLVPVYVNAQNPFDYENNDDVKRVIKRVKEISPVELDSGDIEGLRKGDWVTIEGLGEASPILDAIKSLGYDSIYIEESGIKNLAVFNPNQIKSAIGNNGQFGVTDDIRESRANVIPIVSGKEKPPKLKGKTEVAQFLQQRALNALGRIRDISSARDRDLIATDLVNEAIYEMESQANALEWYDSTIERTVEMMALKHPEIKTNKNDRAAFLMSLAITSQNLAVPDNLKYAEEVYAYYRQNKRFPLKGFGSKAPAIKKNFEKANKLLDAFGSMDELSKFLEKRFPAGELNKVLNPYLGKGAKIGGELVDTLVYGSAVFGPKIGNGFYTNLRGDFSPTTMDMWFMRTIGRLSGRLMDFNEQKFEKQLTRLRQAINQPNASVDNLISLSYQLKQEHERDFKANRELYDAKIRQKSEATNAAITIVNSLKSTRDAPSSGNERNQLRDIVDRALRKFSQRTGLDIPAASFQALIWYPEQDLYKKLGVKLRHVRQDYAKSTADFLRKEGIDEREIRRADSRAKNRVRSRRERGAERVRQGITEPVVQGLGADVQRTVPAVQEVRERGPVEEVREARRFVPRPAAAVQIQPTQPGPSVDTDSTSAAGALADGQPVNSMGIPTGPQLTDTMPDGTVDISRARIAPVTSRLVSQLIQSAPDKLRSGFGLDALAARIENYYDAYAAKLGLVNNEIRDAYNNIGLGGKQSAVDTFERYIRARENNRATEAQDILSSASDSDRQLIDAWNRISVETGRINLGVRTPEGNPMKVWDSKIKKWRDIRAVGVFFPRTLRKEVLEVMKNPDVDPELFKDLLDSLVQAKKANTPREAEEYLVREWFSDEVKNDYFAGVEKARNEQLPEIFYDYSWDAATRYLRKWARRTSQIENFGQELGEFKKEWFGTNIPLIRDQETQNYLNAIRERIYEVEPFDSISNMANWLNSLATATQLGNPISASLNLFGGTITNIQEFGILQIAKSYLDLVRDWKNVQREGTTLGILNKDFMNILSDHTEMDADKYFSKEQKISQALAKFANTTLTFGGFNGAENIVRASAMLAAKSWLTSSLKAVNSNPESSKAKKFYEWVKRENLNADKLILENGAGKETEKFLRRAVNVPQGSYQIDMTPVFIDSTAGRFFFKYQKFGTQINRFFYRHYLRPLLDKPTPANALRLIGFVGTAIIGGNAILALREAFGYGDPGPDDDEILKAFDNEDTARAWGLIGTRAFENIMAAGTSGFFGNYLQFAKDWQDQQRVKNPMNPPGMASIDAVIDVFNRLRDQKTITARDLDEIAESTLSFYRANKRIGLAAMDEIGSDAREVNRFAAQRELREIREYGRRFSEEMDIEFKRTTAPGAPIRTEMTPVNKAITDSLHMGDSERAKILMKEALKDLPPKERMRVRQSIQSSIRNRQPLQVGGNAPSQQERREFVKWAKENLPPEKVQMILNADRDYRRAAARMGMGFGG